MVLLLSSLLDFYEIFPFSKTKNFSYFFLFRFFFWDMTSMRLGGLLLIHLLLAIWLEEVGCTISLHDPSLRMHFIIENMEHIMWYNILTLCGVTYGTRLLFLSLCECNTFNLFGWIGTCWLCSCEQWFIWWHM